jgi:hypothetical protein
MENSSSKASWLGSFFVALSIVLASMFLSGAWKQTHPTGEYVIDVTGLASQDFESDLIVWSGAFAQKAMTMKDAYEGVKRNAEAVKNYLIGKGVKPEDVTFSAVDIKRETKSIRNDKGNVIGEEFDGFTLSQSVRIESHEVNKVESISREVTELIDQGVEFYSNAPNYYYTKLADLKIKMLAAATADARTRAEKIATGAHGSLGRLKTAEMGVFQITGQNSSEEYTYGGAFNTTSKMKTASITVKLAFEVD